MDFSAVDRWGEQWLITAGATVIMEGIGLAVEAATMLYCASRAAELAEMAGEAAADVRWTEEWGVPSRMSILEMENSAKGLQILMKNEGVGEVPIEQTRVMQEVVRKGQTNRQGGKYLLSFNGKDGQMWILTRDLEDHGDAHGFSKEKWGIRPMKPEEFCDGNYIVGWGPDSSLGKYEDGMPVPDEAHMNDLARQALYSAKMAGADFSLDDILAMQKMMRERTG